MLTRLVTRRLPRAPHTLHGVGVLGGGGLRRLHYEQGQSPKPGIREYFYYIDHQGMLFMDDARMKNFTSCFKEKKFLQFFFNRIKLNETERFPEFPFFSPCGRERNYIRCDDLPLVFTHLVETGRVYHPALERMGGVGLVRSKLAIQLSTHFIFGEGEEQAPTHLEWGGRELRLSQSVVPVLQGLEHVRRHSLGLEDDMAS
ncbi:UPF0598 protein C8orf82 [Chionoecetes opilio]|uniref:UPF0598 protein C8orf82 n=1 Tax=Chionoecetes opilio TaxID=41210 RepID=A0A8J4Z4Z9_CHIOP|nr:UPF0598 protein C8orf82 [Chionoecetes opilio]